MEETRICKKCGKDKDIKKYRLSKNGKSRGRTCEACVHRVWYHKSGKLGVSEKLAKRDKLEPKRTCDACDTEKVITKFGSTGGGYRRRTCQDCIVLSTTDNRRLYYLNLSPEKRKDRALVNKAQGKTRRVVNIPGTILTDCRLADRKKGFSDENLTVEFVTALIASGCTYCGETDLRMTLDRKDNTKGHSQENVVAACIRCNYHRGSMPYEAWLHIAPAVRSARELGLFGTWRSQPFNKKS